MRLIRSPSQRFRSYCVICNEVCCEFSPWAAMIVHHREFQNHVKEFLTQLIRCNRGRAIHEGSHDQTETALRTHLKRFLEPGGGIPRVTSAGDLVKKMSPGSVDNLCPEPSSQKSSNYAHTHQLKSVVSSGWEYLPEVLSNEILNLLEDARYIASAKSVCKVFRHAGKQVRSLRLVVLEVYHARARALDLQSDFSGKLAVSNGGQSSSSQENHGERLKLKYKDQLVHILLQYQFLVQLRIEVEALLQAKTVPDDEKRKTDFWISDPNYVKQWLPPMSSTLEHICIVDYGQQAILRKSSIMRVLSQHCKRLKTLDLRNMFIDTSNCEKMPSMRSLTWRCVKVTAEALDNINELMPKLQTLALLGVFGAERGRLTFPDMKVLCLGLSTVAKEVVMDLPKLEKLQLKMQCPEKLTITAVTLKYIAINLDVSEAFQPQLSCAGGVQELLCSSFMTLPNIIETNTGLKKIFLDIPCMALAEDGRFLGVLKDVPLVLPNFTKLYDCAQLEVLNVGPGLWYCMETNVEVLSLNEKWPGMSELILHMIPMNLDPVIRLLGLLLRSSVKILVVYVHTSSPVQRDRLEPAILNIIADCEEGIKLTIKTWTMNLDFSCFSF